MIGAIVKVITTVVIHLLLFILYPDTGKYGDTYLWVSIALWSSFWLTLHFKFASLKNLLFPIPFLIRVAAMLAMIFFITLTMPQDDGRPVIYKLAKMKLPDQQQIQRGKIKYLNYFTFSGPVNEGILIKKVKQVVKILGDNEL